MRLNFLFLLPAAAITASVNAAVIAGAADRRLDRTEREAIKLLGVILRDRANPLHPCALADRWLSDRPVYASTARKYLGNKLNADLIGPETSAAPANLLDPNGTMPKYFCSNDEAQAYKAMQLSEFRNDSPVDKELSQASKRRIDIRRIEFARPIFDRGWKTAVVNVTYENLSWIKNTQDTQPDPKIFDPDRIIRRPNLHATGIEYVYRKKNGVWHLVSDDAFFTAH